MNLLETSFDELLKSEPPQAVITKITGSIKTPGSDRLHNFSVEANQFTIIGSNINQTETEYGDPRYTVGDWCIYIALDSVLDAKLEGYLFPPDSKIKLKEGRIRILKLRQAYSYGMIVELEEGLFNLYPELRKATPGQDVSKILGVTKFEPPVPTNSLMRAGQTSKKRKDFPEYTDIRHLKYYKNVFEEGELVSVSVKIHGTNFRAGILPTQVDSLWKRIKKVFGFLPPYTFCYGSRRVQLQNKPKNYKGFYADNVYRIAAEQNNIEDKLQPNEIIYGEVISKGIQKNYCYNVPEGTYKILAFDIKKDGRFLDPHEFRDFCKERDIETAPFLGDIPYNEEVLNGLAAAKVCYNGQKIREGVVLKKLKEQSHPLTGSRVALKLINPAYLMRDDCSDFH